MKRVAISQSNYIPWRGYFHMIDSVDAFVLLDEVQYTRRDWRNRNKIKTPNGAQWLTIPVNVKGRYTQRISETYPTSAQWAQTHLRTLTVNYAKAPFYERVMDMLDPLYTHISKQTVALSTLNGQIIRALSREMGINTPIYDSFDFDMREEPSERLLDICSQLNAEIYLSGPAAHSYLNVDIFHEQNIQVAWMSYPDYTPYSQLWGSYIPRLSILDCAFNIGFESCISTWAQV